MSLRSRRVIEVAESTFPTGACEDTVRRLAYGCDREWEMEDRRRIRRDCDALLQILEPRGRGGDGVVPDGNRGKFEFAILVPRFAETNPEVADFSRTCAPGIGRC